MTTVRRGPAKSGPKMFTTTELADLEPIDELDIVGKPGEKGTAAVAIARVGPAVKAEWRNKSLRAYRRHVDRYIRWMNLGMVSPRDAKDAVTVVRTAAELLMSEIALAATGREDAEPIHARGDDGGAYIPEDVKSAVKISVEKTVGVDQQGNPIDQTKVTMEGGPDLRNKVPLLGVDDADPFA